MRNERLLRVALYARVSSDQQKQEGTIASQVEALGKRIGHDGYPLAKELCFLDDGYSGTTVVRPALERLRDQVANGAIDRLYVHSPDRLARQYAYQFLLLEEFQRAGVDVIFLNRELAHTPEDALLLQVQGIIAEYERAKIRERSRRGKQYAAHHGRISVLSAAPYGYRYVTKQEGAGQARYEVVSEEARVVQKIFVWVAHEGLSLRAVARRLAQQHVLSPAGQRHWSSATLLYLLKNPAYKGQAGFGKRRSIERQPRLRPCRARPGARRCSYSVTTTDTQPIYVEVPAVIGEAEFTAVAERLAENRCRWRCRRKGARHLLQGLLVCTQCGYAWSGVRRPRRGSGRGRGGYAYYGCGGKQAARWNQQPPCPMRLMRAAELEDMVWQDVCELLRHPEKIAEEYRRRLHGAKAGPHRAALDPTAKVIAHVKRTIARLIDAYSEGYLDKGEFEPRLRHAKDRLQKLETEARQQTDEETQQEDLRAALGSLEQFADQVREGLENVCWSSRREIIRALVKRIEMGEEAIRIVYRVAPFPFVKGPNGAVLQDCWKRLDSL